MTVDPFHDKPEDYLNRSLRAGVGLLPVVGAPLVEFLAFAIGDPAQERRDDFMRALFEEVTTLQTSLDAFRPENLRANEQFQATFLDAIRLAATTASADKKTLLRNAVLNSVVDGLDESLRLKLVDILGRMTPAHIRLLVAIAQAPGPVESFVADDDSTAFEFNHALMADMYGMFLIRNNQQMIGEKALQEKTDRSYVRPTELGRRFLEFVREPSPGT
ncbi:hypothetical protein ACVWXL_003114 [Bradyrhizobium sp. GM22.5]